MTFPRLLTLPLSLAVSLTGAHATLAENAFRHGACNGIYAVHSAGASATAGPLTIPVGLPVLTNAKIKMGQCGREMVVTADGISAVLYQEIFDDRSYSGHINMGDGAKRVLTLTVGDDRNLRGAVVASDPNLKVTRPLWFMLTSASETRFEGCVDDQQEAAPPRGLSQEAAAVINQLSAQGFTPADSLQFADYVTSQTPDAQAAHVSLRLSLDNAILPRPEVAAQQMDDESAYCLGNERLDPARRILDFKVLYADDDPFVFARLIDVETGKILQQVEGKPSQSGEAALTSAVADAWGKLAPATTGMTDGVLR